MKTATHIIIRDLGIQPYASTWEKMRTFTDNRTEKTTDELWVLEHPPVFTQGLAGKKEHILNPHNIPVIQTDRGGQVTYHGPGQLVIYPLIDVKRKNLHARQLVSLLENSVIDLLKQYHVEAYSECKAPGVYVDGKKICSIGLRLRKGGSYHGIALNVDMDLTPFSYINPCGYAGMQMTQIKALAATTTINEAKTALIDSILLHFNFQRL